MPLVFVHGVATRQTPEYLATVAQRDALFQRLVIGEQDRVLNPDWGSNAVHFLKGGWVPDTGAAEPFRIGAPPVVAQGASAGAIVASHDVEKGIDLAIAALLQRDAQAGKPPTKEQLQVFEAAVKYLEGQPDKGAFAPTDTDTQFARTLKDELTPLLPAAPAPGEAMGLGDVFTSIGDAMKSVTDRLRNAGSDAVLKLIRKPLSNQVALFLGDIFVYLRWRETDGANGTWNRIFEPIIKDLSTANAERQPDQKLIVVAHSLGAVILYDLFTDKKALDEIAARSGKPLAVDAWFTVGAQPGLFADMGLYAGQRADDGRLPKPACTQRWLNVYDVTDVLSFRTVPFFSGVDDFEYDNVAGALEAHSAYFQRPSFYARLRTRLAQP